MNFRLSIPNSRRQVFLTVPQQGVMSDAELARYGAVRLLAANDGEVNLVALGMCADCAKLWHRSLQPGQLPQTAATAHSPNLYPQESIRSIQSETRAPFFGLR